MQSLLEVLSASVQLINLPFTIMLGAVLCYWLLVSLGMFDIESADSAVGVDMDMDMDMDVDTSLGGDAIGHGQGLGLFHGIFQFLHAGEAPFMAVVSLLVVCLWAISVIGNYYFNPGESWLIALGLLLPNLVISAVLTRLMAKPLRKAFKVLNTDYDKALPIVGQTCEILTSEVTRSFGQANVETKGAPLTIQVRVSGEETLHRGDRALVVSHDPQNHTYLVRKVQEPNLPS